MKGEQKQHRATGQYALQQTGSFFFAVPSLKEHNGSVTTAESSQKTGASGSRFFKRRQAPVISQKLMRILDRVAEEESFKDDGTIFSQRIQGRQPLSKRDKSVSLDEHAMYAVKQGDISFGRLDDEKAPESYLLEAHDANRRSKIAKLTHRINAAYKHGPMEGPGLVTNVRVPRSAGSTIDNLTHSQRIQILPMRVHFGSVLQDSSFKLVRPKKSKTSDSVYSIGIGQRAKSDVLKRDQSLQVLSLVARSQQRNKGVGEFASSKRIYCVSSDSPEKELQLKQSCSKNAAIENMTKKYLQRISINSNKVYAKRLAESQLQSRMGDANFPSKALFLGQPHMQDPSLQNQSINIKAIRKRPHRNLLSKALGHPIGKEATQAVHHN